MPLAEPPVVDPRTLTAVSEFGNCHIIPACFEVSSLTVRLDRKVDSELGALCDAHLPGYFATLLLQRLKGRLALEGGTAAWCVTFDPKAGTFSARPPAHGLEDFLARALNLRDGNVGILSFHGITVDTYAAHVSILHSAFLLLYHRRRPDVFSRSFDWVRSLFAKTRSRTLTREDGAVLQKRIALTVGLSPGVIKEPMSQFEALRRYYDPEFDLDDRVFSEFPANSVAETEQAWQVILPYSRSLRARVTFPK